MLGINASVNTKCLFGFLNLLRLGEETTVVWVGPSFKEDKSCWELSGVSSWKFSVSVKTALPMPCVVDLNFKPFLPFLLLDFPLSESFQR